MAGRELPPTSAFAGDDGAADPALAAALATCVAGGADAVVDVVAALRGARVLVPVVAVEDEAVEPVGPAQGEPFAERRNASAGVVAVSAPDGRTALPVFSSVVAMAAWHPAARPMPAEGSRAAAAALAEGWDLLVVDPGCQTPVVVPRPAVHALATGGEWVPAVRAGVVRPDVAAAIARALTGVAHLRSATAAPGDRAEVAVVVGVAPGLGRAALDAVLADVGARLAADEGVTAAVDSIELRVVSGAEGPGPAPRTGTRRAAGRRRPRG